jgi:hypothetical protein
MGTAYEWRRLLGVGVILVLAVIVISRSGKSAASCPGPGRWVSSDRDVMVLGQNGSASITLGALSSFQINGTYTIDNNTLHIVGQDLNGRRRDLSLIIQQCTDSRMTTGHDPNRGMNPVTPNPVQWQKQ